MSSFYNFPNPCDMTLKSVQDTPEEKIGELISHVQMKMERLMSFGSTNSMHVQHCESLLVEARKKQQKNVTSEKCDSFE